MLIIGLTGSIAMGKSSACKYLAGKGLPVWSADQSVHELYSGQAALLIEAVFPGTTNEYGVDRQLLSKYLMAYPRAMGELEAIIHPLVERERNAFINQHLEEGSATIILDIPLLLEKGFEEKVDVILLVTAPMDVQKERVLQRPGMSDEKYAMIRSHQMDDGEKREKADYVVDTSGSFEQTHERLDSFLESLHDWPQKAAERMRDKNPIQ